MKATRANGSMITMVGAVAIAASVLLGATGVSAAPTATPRHAGPDAGSEATSVVSGAGVRQAPAWGNVQDGTIGGRRQQGRYPIGFLADC